VRHLKRFGSYYAVAHSVAAVVEAIVRDTKGIFPLSEPCPPHYGHEGLVLALPAVVGAGGVERILEINLDDEERAAQDKCGQAIAKTIESMGS